MARTIRAHVGVLPVNKSLSVDDVLGITDSVAINQGPARALSDSIGILDTVSVIRSSSKALADVLGISDSVSYLLGGISHGSQVNAANTGLAGVGLTSADMVSTSGATTFATSNVIVELRRFTGPVTLSGSNIIFRKCLIEVPAGTTSQGILNTGIGNLIEDCTIVPASGSHLYTIRHQAGSGLIVRRTDASGGANIVYTEAASITLDTSFLHDTSIASIAGAVADTTEFVGGNGHVISKCRIGESGGPEVAAITIAPFSGATSIDGVSILDTFLDGGANHIKVDLQSTGFIRNVRVQRNRMGGHTTVAYSPLLDVNSRGTVQTAAEQASNQNAILWPTTGVDLNTWFTTTPLSPNRDGQTIVPPTTSTNPLATPQFAGHVPFKVLLGCATANDGASHGPTYDQARTLHFQTPMLSRRMYSTGTYSSSAVQGFWQAVDSRDDEFMMGSFKSRVTTEASLYSGGLDATLNQVIADAKTRRNAGGRPYALTFWHEPNTDQPAGMTGRDWHILWGKMQQYCCDYINGKKRSNATQTTASIPYVASNDVSDVLAWFAILNGFKWGGSAANDGDNRAAYSQSVIDTFRINGGLLGTDFYDSTNVSSTGDGNPNTIPLSSRRLTSHTGGPVGFIQAMLNYMLPLNPGCFTIGELGSPDSAEFAKCWALFKANRDRFAAVQFYNTITNSIYEWRLIPNSWPTQDGIALSSYTWAGGHEIGGTQWTENSLNEAKIMFAETNNPAIMTPLP